MSEVDWKFWEDLLNLSFYPRTQWTNVCAMSEADAPEDSMDKMCACYHRRRFHEGRNLDCVMGGCYCRKFTERPEPNWGGETT